MLPNHIEISCFTSENGVDLNLRAQKAKWFKNLASRPNIYLINSLGI